MYILNISYRTWLCYVSIIREHSSGQIMEKSSSKRRSFLHYPLSQRSWNQAITEYFLPGLPSSWIVDTRCHLFSTTGVKSKTEKNQTTDNFLTFTTICRGFGQKNTKVFWHQSEARTTATVWNWSGKTLSPGAVLYFSSCHIFPPV